MFETLTNFFHALINIVRGQEELHRQIMRGYCLEQSRARRVVHYSELMLMNLTLK